jgi:hypothetical protein
MFYIDLLRSSLFGGGVLPMGVPKVPPMLVHKSRREMPEQRDAGKP